MQQKIMRYILLGILYGSLLISCAEEPEDNQTDQNLEGRWSIHSATVNDEQTHRMDDLYFEFSGEDQMKTNLMGTEGSFNYSRTDNIITQSGEIPVSYEVESYDDSTMTLRTTIRNSDFRFTLRREFMAPPGESYDK